MKRNKIIFWTATLIIFLFDTVMPALTSHTELAKEGIRHLGYPDYFRVLLTIFKVAGGLLLIFPYLPARLKEWVYAGFAFNFIFAFLSGWIVDGFNPMLLLPLVILAILIVSYVYYHKLIAAGYWSKHKSSREGQLIQSIL